MCATVKLFIIGVKKATMTERSLILMGGAPGSGTTRLGHSLEQQLRFDAVSIDHLSVGDSVRRIGAGTIHSAMTAEIINHLLTGHINDPIDDVVMQRIVDESLESSSGTEVILLDGYPRYPAQVDSVKELAMRHERTIRGMLLTNVPSETALTRMIKRGQKNRERSMTLNLAIDRLDRYYATSPELLETIEAKGIPIEVISTAGQKEVTTEIGLLALRAFLS
jgi:adenylate kinase family enzyme